VSIDRDVGSIITAWHRALRWGAACRARIKALNVGRLRAISRERQLSESNRQTASNGDAVGVKSPTGLASTIHI
jgi:hypothetical protein